MPHLDVLWYLIVVVSVIMYAVLDGFDLGVGCLLPFAEGDEERRLFLNSIGPIWDGNEVWLVIVGGALFAGFPDVFATIFSASYDFVMLLLAGLIFRAVSIEFRSKRKSTIWRKTWDAVFSISSFIIAFGVGLVLGNVIQGIPLNEQQDLVGSALTFIRPYPILFGLTTVALFTMHGSIYLTMKISGTFQEKVRPWIKRSIFVFIGCYLLLSIFTFTAAPHMTERMVENPWMLAVPLIAFLAIFNVPRLVHKRSDGWAFIFSCLSIAFLLLLFPLGTYPILLRSSIDPDAYSLTIANSASSPLTLKVLLTIVVIGMPLVIAYGAYVYHVFRGKVKLDSSSY